MFEMEPDIPLDLFVGLLCEHTTANEVGSGIETSIYELPFANNNNNNNNNNYRRVPTTQIDWFTPDGITMLNTSELLFPEVVSNWGVITYFGLWLSEKNNDCLCMGDLNTPRMIYKGDRVKFPIKSIAVEIEYLAMEYEQYKFEGRQ